MREVYELELTNAPWPPATRPMSALGQKQTLGKVRLMSALPPKADIGFGPGPTLNSHPSAIVAVRL